MIGYIFPKVWISKGHEVIGKINYTFNMTIHIPNSHRQFPAKQRRTA